MCKFCTYLFFLQFTLSEHVIYMTCNNSSVLLKQLCHLSLCQPHRLALQANIYLCLSVLCLFFIGIWPINLKNNSILQFPIGKGGKEVEQEGKGKEGGIINPKFNDGCTFKIYRAKYLNKIARRQD